MEYGVFHIATNSDHIEYFIFARKRNHIYMGNSTWFIFGVSKNALGSTVDDKIVAI